MDMKKIILSLHSCIDVITNSSTSIYVNPHSGAIESAKGILSDILKVAGIVWPVEDYFDVYMALSENTIESRQDDISGFDFSLVDNFESDKLQLTTAIAEATVDIVKQWLVEKLNNLNLAYGKVCKDTKALQKKELLSKWKLTKEDASLAHELQWYDSYSEVLQLVIEPKVAGWLSLPWTNLVPKILALFSMDASYNG